MIRRWLAQYKANSPESKRRELRAINEELRWLEREHDRLAERRDELVTEMRPALMVVSR